VSFDMVLSFFQPEWAGLLQMDRTTGG